MSPAKKKPAVKVSLWKAADPSGSLDDSEQLANALLAERPDLLPSIERIMNAPLEPQHRMRAMTLFHHALENPLDIHRDPRVAIENCGS